jgi:hypothetical protein
MKKLLLLLLLLGPTLAYSQLPGASLAYNPTRPAQEIQLSTYRVKGEADDIRRAKKAVVFGTALNVAGAALALLAPQLHKDPQTVRTIKYVGLGVGVTGFAFSIPAVFVLTKNRNRFY